MKLKKEKYITHRGDSYQVRIRDGSHNITRTFAERNYPSPKIALDAAVRFRDKTLYEIRMGLIQETSSCTVQDMFDCYIETSVDSFKTKRKHTYLFGKYVTLKDKRIQEVTRADIQEDLNRMVEIASNDTISKVFSIWRNAIIGTALMKEIIVRDLTLGVRKPQSKMIKIPKDHKVDKETVEMMKGYIKKSMQDKYNANIIGYLLDVLYYTGMRPAEALALTRKDIRGNKISITKEIGSSIDDVDQIRRCKTVNSIREVPIHPELKPILKELMDFARTDNLFYKSDGHVMNSDYVGTIIARICRLEGIKFNMYRLRHNMATKLVTNNVDSKTTVEILGHGNYDMSIYYASSNDDLKEDAIKYLA